MGKLVIKDKEPVRPSDAKLGNLAYGTIFRWRGATNSTYVKISSRDRDVGKGITLRKTPGHSLAVNLKLGTMRELPGDTIVTVMDSELHVSETQRAEYHYKEI